MKLEDYPVLEAQIDERIEEWNSYAGELLPLNEYLGLTLSEYGDLVLDRVVPDDYKLPE